MTAPDLSIIIVNYNTREPLRRCLDSIRAHRGALAVETIVVDNGSRDGSPELVRSRAPDVKLIEPGYNSWFTGGNNIGLRAAAAPYVFILNPDTVLLEGTLQTLLAYLRANPRAGALTCRMAFPDGRLQQTCSRLPAYPDLLLGYTFLGLLLAPLRDRRRRAMWYTGWQRDSTRAVEVIPDSALMAPRDLLQELGGFDETLKLYFTEDDICRRISEAGYGVFFVAGAALLHEEHASVSQVQRLASRVYFEDLLIFCRKYHGRAGALLLQALMLPTQWAMALAQRLRGERESLHEEEKEHVQAG